MYTHIYQVVCSSLMEFRSYATLTLSSTHSEIEKLVAVYQQYKVPDMIGTLIITRKLSDINIALRY